MSHYLGIDTSNYTTSAAIYDDETNVVYSSKKLLPVSSNSLGLRQSDAVFAHVKQLSFVIDELMHKHKFDIKKVCVSTRPRTVEGSYMPAFLVGDMVASTISSILGIEKVECSHQEGHIVAALYSSTKLNLLNEEFFAFHVSGGTTECLKVTPNDKLFDIELIAKTLDLNAGQLIDRVGVMLNLDFPCGKKLDELSLNCVDNIKIKPTLKGNDCHLSGVENQCKKLFDEGYEPCYIAKYAISYVKMTIDKMTENILTSYGKKPLLYAGGVMSNTIIREHIKNKYEGNFAAPEFSTDNAAGVAIIASII